MMKVFRYPHASNVLLIGHYPAMRRPQFFG